MATYKVPQDVEAEDKLLGPFTFRQFIYLLIAGASIAVTFGLFQIFPLLAIIPTPIVCFFLLLALPLKKDQPMEIYLASIASFYLKPNKRIWTAGQRESTIKITAPKIVEKPRARNITEEEASTRLSFLSNLVDSEGYSIRGNSNFNEEFIAEASSIPDILDQNSNQVINQMIAKEQENRHATLISHMKAAISSADQVLPTSYASPSQPYPNQSPQFSFPNQPSPQTPSPFNPSPQSSAPQYVNGFINQSLDPTRNQELQNLANNQVFSIDTISKQANRLSQVPQNPTSSFNFAPAPPYSAFNSAPQPPTNPNFSIFSPPRS